MAAEVVLRILAVDPGLTRCGMAVAEALPARRVRLSFVDVVTTDPAIPLGERLLRMEEGLAVVFEEFEPSTVVVEQVFSQRNVRTVLGTAQVAGLVALMAARRGLSTTTYTPSEVKAAVTGSGRADKRQVADMVGRIVRTTIRGPADATDAVALAICHCWRGGGAAGQSAGMVAAR